MTLEPLRHGRPPHPRWKQALAYAAMAPLEVYGRLRGVYRPLEPLPPYAVRHAPAPTDRPIVAYGDSITAGRGARPGCGWPALLSQRLGLPVLNLGRGGAMASDGLAGFDELVLPHRPGLVILAFGGNDLLRKRPPAEVFADLSALTGRVHACGAVAVLVGLRGSWLFGIDYITPFRSLALERGAALVPSILDGIWGNPLRMADAAHPNARGYAVMAQRIGGVVEQLIARD